MQGKTQTFSQGHFCCKTDKSKKEMQMSKQIQKCPPRFLISFPEIKAKKAFLKGKAIPDNPQQIAWPELCPATGEIRGSSMCISLYSLHQSPEVWFSCCGDRNFVQAPTYSLRNSRRETLVLHGLSMWTELSTMLEFVWDNCAQFDHQISHRPPSHYYMAVR